MLLPSSRFTDLHDRRTLWSPEHRDDLRLLAVVAGAWGLGGLCRCESRCVDHGIKCLQGDGASAMDANRFVALPADKPVIALARDQSAIGKTVDDLLAGTAFDGVWKPDDLALGVLMGVGQHCLLRDGELGGHGDVLIDVGNS